MVPITVLLVDDHAVVRAGYRRFLEAAPGIDVVGEAGGADAGYIAFCACRPDICVIDLSMPGVGGFELIRRIVQREAEARVLAFSMHEEPLFATQALRAGAKGYITKNSAPVTLLEAVMAVYHGRRYLSPDLAQSLALAEPAERSLDALTTKEFEVFRMIAQGSTLAEIAVALSLSQKTIANYQTAIKEKLGVATTAAMVHVALRHGVIRMSYPE